MEKITIIFATNLHQIFQWVSQIPMQNSTSRSEMETLVTRDLDLPKNPVEGDVRTNLTSPSYTGNRWLWPISSRKCWPYMICYNIMLLMINSHYIHITIPVDIPINIPWNLDHDMLESRIIHPHIPNHFLSLINPYVLLYMAKLCKHSNWKYDFRIKTFVFVG